MTEQDAKTQILTVAMAVIAQKGFAKASMNDIVRESGLSKGGVYWHFKSKDELLTAIFDQFFSGQTEILDAVLTGEGSAGDKLRQLARQAGTDTQRMAENFPSPLEFYALAARDDVLHRALQVHLNAYLERLATLVEQGIAAGEFRTVSPLDAAHTLASLMEGAVLIWAVSPVKGDLTYQLETAVHLLLTGLQT